MRAQAKMAARTRESSGWQRFGSRQPSNRNGGWCNPHFPRSPNGTEKARRWSAIAMILRAEAGPPSKRPTESLRFREQDLRGSLSE